MSALRVLPIEHDLLTITRAVVGMLPSMAVRSVLFRGAEANERRQLEKGLTSGALTSFRQTLARGGVQALLRRGGWRSRLWAQSPDPLVFTEATFEIARWLTLAPLGQAKVEKAPALELKSGDELFLYLVGSLLGRLGLPLEPLGPAIAHSALAQLAFPDGLTASTVAEPERVAGLLDMPSVLEGVERDLVYEHVLRIEARKAQIRDPAQLVHISRLAESRLSAFVDAALSRDRLDCLRFLAEACVHLVEREPTDALDPGATLQARQQARIASAGVLRVAARVAAAHEALRHIGFVDDEYDAAQALLSAWEPYALALRRASILS